MWTVFTTPPWKFPTFFFSPKNERLDSNEMTGLGSLGSRFNFFHEILVCFFFFLEKWPWLSRPGVLGVTTFFFKASDFFKIIPFRKWLVTPIYILSHEVWRFWFRGPTLPDLGDENHQTCVLTTYPSHGMIDEFIPLWNSCENLHLLGVLKLPTPETPNCGGAYQAAQQAISSLSTATPASVPGPRMTCPVLGSGIPPQKTIL